MPQLTLALSPDESLVSLSELLEQDLYVESLETKLAVLKDETKELKQSLKDAISRRSVLSWQARQGAVKADDSGSDAGAPVGGNVDTDDRDEDEDDRDDEDESDDLSDDGETEDDSDDVGSDDDTGEFNTDTGADTDGDRQTIPVIAGRGRRKRTG